MMHHLGHHLGHVCGMSGASSWACLGHHLGMSGASSGALSGASSGACLGQSKISALLHASLMPFLFISNSGDCYWLMTTTMRMSRIKCRLGYAELHKPAPGFGPGEAEVRRVVSFQMRQNYIEELRL